MTWISSRQMFKEFETKVWRRRCRLRNWRGGCGWRVLLLLRWWPRVPSPCPNRTSTIANNGLLGWRLLLRMMRRARPSSSHRHWLWHLKAHWHLQHVQIHVVTNTHFYTGNLCPKITTLYQNMWFTTPTNKPWIKYLSIYSVWGSSLQFMNGMYLQVIMNGIFFSDFQNSLNATMTSKDS